MAAAIAPREGVRLHGDRAVDRQPAQRSYERVGGSSLGGAHSDRELDPGEHRGGHDLVALQRRPQQLARRLDSTQVVDEHRGVDKRAHPPERSLRTAPERTLSTNSAPLSSRRAQAPKALSNNRSRSALDTAS